MPYRLTYNRRPWTVNAQNNMHYRTRAKHVKEWRQAFEQLAREAHVPPCEQIGVDVFVYVKNRRWMPDPGACYGAVKAAIDGLVDAGVIANDRGEEVAWIRMWPATVTGEDALRLVITDLANEEEAAEGDVMAGRA